MLQRNTCTSLAPHPVSWTYCLGLEGYHVTLQLVQQCSSNMNSQAPLGSIHQKQAKIEEFYRRRSRVFFSISTVWYQPIRREDWQLVKGNPPPLPRHEGVISRGRKLSPLRGPGTTRT